MDLEARRYRSGQTSDTNHLLVSFNEGEQQRGSCSNDFSEDSIDDSAASASDNGAIRCGHWLLKTWKGLRKGRSQILQTSAKVSLLRVEIEKETSQGNF